MSLLFFGGSRKFQTYIRAIDCTLKNLFLKENTLKLSNASLFDQNMPTEIVQAMESVSGLSIETLANKADAMNNKAELVELFLSRLDNEGQSLLDADGLELSVVSANHLYDLLPDPRFDQRKMAMGMNGNILYVNIDHTFDQPMTNALLRHELTHYDQIRRGDLQILSDLRNVQWRGKTFDIADIQLQMALGERSAFEEYHRLPWEEEADAAYYQYLLEHHTHVIDESFDMNLARDSWIRFNGLGA